MILKRSASDVRNSQTSPCRTDSNSPQQTLEELLTDVKRLLQPLCESLSLTAQSDAEFINTAAGAQKPSSSLRGGTIGPPELLIAADCHRVTGFALSDSYQGRAAPTGIVFHHK